MLGCGGQTRTEGASADPVRRWPAMSSAREASAKTSLKALDDPQDEQAFRTALDTFVAVMQAGFVAIVHVRITTCGAPGRLR